VTGTGLINLHEADAVTLTSVTTANGPITVTAGGTITVGAITSLFDSDANDVTLTSTVGSILIPHGTINAGSQGDVFLTALNGEIVWDGQVTADNLDMRATSLLVVMDDIDSFPTGTTSFTGTGAATMSITAGTVNSIVYTFNTHGAGVINVDGRVINIGEAAAITDMLVAQNRTFTFADAAANQIAIGDDGVAGNRMSRLTSVAMSPQIDFTNPAVLLQLNAGSADDRVTVSNLDSLSGAGLAFGAQVLIRGESGNDTIDASASTYGLVIEGNAGNDWIAGGAGNDLITGGDGNDTIIGNAGDDTIHGNAGDDVILGDEGTITLQGGTLMLVASSNTATGGADTIWGDDGNDVIIGGAAGDEIHGGEGNDIILGDNGRVTYATGKPQRVESTDPTLGGNDWIEGNGGQDILIGGTGSDLMSGDTGTADTSGPTDGRDLMFGDNARVQVDGIPGQNFASIFTAATDGGGNDVMYGNGGGDVMLGQQGSDTMYGGDGDDDMWGGHNVAFGADTGDIMHGGAGADVMLGDNGSIVRTMNTAGTDWVRTPSPFSEVVRDVTFFDSLDLVGGNDVMYGDAGNDRMWGQRGDDTMFGGAGDDQMIGGLGNDTLAGEDGHDILLGDVGVITRAYNPNGTPRLNPNGSWHKDVLLTDLATITGRVDLNGLAWSDLGRALATSVTSPDLLLLTGAYNSDGSLRLLPQTPAAPWWGPRFEWDTELLLLSLIPDGSDNLDGGAGDDALFGQRGNDTLTGGVGTDLLVAGVGDDRLEGGDGNDWLVGDQASLLTEDGAVPNVANAIQLLPGGVEAAAGVSLTWQGTTLLPFTTVVPGHDVDPGQGLLAQLRGVPGAPSDNTLQRMDGSRLVPFATIVPGFAGHLDLVAGNDTLLGGAGDDVLTGDNATVMAERLTFTDASMDRALTVTADFLDVADDLTDLVHALHYTVANDEGLPPIWSHTVVVDQTLRVGNDLLDGGSGNDNLTGDDRTAIATSLTVTVGQLDSLEFLVKGFDRIEAELEGAGQELIDVEHHLRDEIKQVQVGKSLRTTLVHHVDQLIIGNDQLLGGDGNDLLVGDQQLQMAPMVTVVAGGTRPHGPDPRWHDDDWYDWDHHHHRSWHSNFWSRHGSAHWSHDAGDVVRLGSDTLNGGAGDDVLYGDSLALDTPKAVVDSSVSKKDATWAQHEADEVVAELTELGGHHDHHGWFRHFHNDAQDGYQITDGGDVLSGGDGRDLLFGQGDRDTLDGGAGADWLIGGRGRDTLLRGIDKREDKVSAGVDHSSSLQQELQTRLINWNGQYNGFGSAAGLSFPSPWLADFTLDIDEIGYNQAFVITPRAKRR
jgi:Ca2+-binding RTX toxin-like protein